MEKKEILKIRNLDIDFHTEKGNLKIIRGVSFDVYEGEILAMVGESGCGKSITANSILKLNPWPGSQITGGSINLLGHDIVNTSEHEMQNIRGALAGMIFQDHMTSLNPTMKVGKQLTEVLIRRKLIYRGACKEEAIRLLQSVKIPNAERRIEQYPHEFSGGMRQRVTIAMALALNPRILIADEPTTALDVTTQAQILRLLKKIREERGTSILLITHDMGVVANAADRVAVMYAGKIVEEGRVSDIFNRCAHPYTEALLASIPLPSEVGKQKLKGIPGYLPDLYDMPSGCAFEPRCPYAAKQCRLSEPPVVQVDGEHTATCFYPVNRSNVF